MLHFDDVGRWCIVERNLVKHERFEANVIKGLLGNLIFSTISEKKSPHFDDIRRSYPVEQNRISYVRFVANTMIGLTAKKVRDR